MEELLEQIKRFNKERDWEQYHSPKNLVLALMVEVAEVSEKFQWLTEQESQKLSAEKLMEVREELGDVLIYLVNLADKLNVDLINAARDKLAKNARKYPADQVKGSSRKYTEY